MIRLASYLLAAVAAASAIWFAARYLAGSADLVIYERLALAPLIAGLGAAVLHAYRRQRVSRLATLLGVLLLIGWALFLKIPI